ncbi:hypothetical protein [Actinomadura harenae]|uniref:hypothetical protein n=1 Tax=Actinomadura harenae TaxID=2483351 RepID=UPI003610FB78
MRREVDDAPPDPAETTLGSADVSFSPANASLGSADVSFSPADVAADPAHTVVPAHPDALPSPRRDRQ